MEKRGAKRRFVVYTEAEHSDLHEARGIFMRPVFIYVFVGKSVLKGGNENSAEINVITSIWWDTFTVLSGSSRIQRVVSDQRMKYGKPGDTVLLQTNKTEIVERTGKYRRIRFQRHFPEERHDYGMYYGGITISVATIAYDEPC